MEYKAVFDQAIKLWQSDGGVQSAITYTESALDGQSNPEHRGLLLSLLARLYKRAGNEVLAARKNNEALELVTKPESRAEVLCSALDLCVDQHRIEAGLEYERELRVLFDQERDNPDVSVWEAPALHNSGRLLSLAGDMNAAVPRLRSAIVLFEDGNRVNEAYMTRVSLARAMMQGGHLDEADELCRVVMRADVPERVLAEVSLVRSRLAQLRGNITDAQRLWDKAAAFATGMVGKQDMRILLGVLLAKAELDSARGDAVGAHQLQMLVRQWAAAGRVDGLEE